MIQKLNNVEVIIALDTNFGLAKENTIPWKCIFFRTISWSNYGV